MAQHGGKRPGAGRKPGSKNRATKEQKATFADLAKEYAPEALTTLVSVMNDTEQSGAARVAAANSILDRAYGKPVPLVEDGDDDAPAVGWEIKVRPAKGPVRVTSAE